MGPCRPHGGPPRGRARLRSLQDGRSRRGRLDERRPAAQPATLRMALTPTMAWPVTHPNWEASVFSTVPSSFVARHSPASAFAFVTLRSTDTSETDFVP